MNNKKARQIRKAMAGVRSESGERYESILHPFTIPMAGGGTYTGSMETIRSTGARRAYQLGKKIYKRFGILPKPGVPHDNNG